MCVHVTRKFDPLRCSIYRQGDSVISVRHLYTIGIKLSIYIKQNLQLNCEKLVIILSLNSNFVYVQIVT